MSDGSESFTARADEGPLVTVTLVKPEPAADPGFRERFRTAVATARTLSDAFLVPLVDADVDAPLPWVATRFTAGLPLRQAVERHGPLSEPALRMLADGLARALSALHAAGAVHGGVSPDSVLLTMDGPRIQVLGTAAFGSGPASPASDMFALGTAVLFAASGGTSDTHALPLSLREVIGGCFDPVPPDRPTARQFVTYLSEQNLPVLTNGWLPPEVTADMPAASAEAGGRGTPPAPPAPPAGAGVSRRKLLLALAGGTAVLGGTAAAFALSGDSSPASDGRADGPGPTARPGSTAGKRSARASASPSRSDGPKRVVLAGPDAVPLWSRSGRTAPTCIEGSGKVIMLSTDSATSFLDGATGKDVFRALKPTVPYRESSQHRTAYADGMFYLLCDTPDVQNVLAAFDSSTGRAAWAVALTASDPGGPALISPYLGNYVAVAGKTVYVCGQVRERKGTWAADDPVTGFIRAFDATNGKKLWQVKGTDINNVLVPPTGAHLLAASAIPGKESGRIQMIDAGRKGDRGWKASVSYNSPYFNLGWPLTCYGEGLFLFAGGEGDTLFAVDAVTGREKWHQRFEAKNGDQVHLGTPFTGPDGAVVYVPVGRDLAALTVADGTFRWIAVLDGADEDGGASLFVASLAMGGRHAHCSADTVFATDSAQTLWAIDAATGTARWKYRDPGQPDTGFLWTVGGDHVYIASNLTMTAITAQGR
ncbi:PQQ-binding-like beta-propeller repeat protein [Streptomyces sp. NPDC005426]|uniref:outer membrane protein assembly factor BamB family protein n=1 Tax=Streptomyces sp. NPDC005426 TaxID=3155344 RepID=UPI0033A42B4F